MSEFMLNVALVVSLYMWFAVMFVLGYMNNYTYEESTGFKPHILIGIFWPIIAIGQENHGRASSYTK